MRKDERRGAVTLTVVIALLTAVLWWCGRSRGDEGESISEKEIEILQEVRSDSLNENEELPDDRRDRDVKRGQRGYSTDTGNSAVHKTKRRGRKGGGEGKRRTVKSKMGTESNRDILGDTIGTTI